MLAVRVRLIVVVDRRVNLHLTSLFPFSLLHRNITLLLYLLLNFLNLNQRFDCRLDHRGCRGVFICRQTAEDAYFSCVNRVGGKSPENVSHLRDPGPHFTEEIDFLVEGF